MVLPVEHSPYLWAGSSWLDKCWTYKAPPNAGDKVALQSGGSQAAGLQGRGECPQLVQRSALSSKEGFIAFVIFWMKACVQGICTAGSSWAWSPVWERQWENQTAENRCRGFRRGIRAAGCLTLPHRVLAEPPPRAHAALAHRGCLQRSPNRRRIDSHDDGRQG